MMLRGLKFALIAALLTMSTLAQATEYMIGASASHLYLLGTDLSVNGYAIPNAGSITGITSKGNTVYVMDDTGTLRTIKVSTVAGGKPEFDITNSVQFKDSNNNPITSLGALAMTGSGIYAIDKSTTVDDKGYSSGKYAYIPSGSSSLNYITAGIAPLTGIAGYSNGVILTGSGINPNHTEYEQRASYVATSAGAMTLVDNSYIPSGIAIGPAGTGKANPYAYVISTITQEDPTAGGSIAVVDAETGGAVVGGYFDLSLYGGLIPQDITTFQIDSQWYLGITGYYGNGDQQAAWRIALEDGIPNISTKMEYNIVGNDLSNNHACAASGSSFWFANPQGGTVSVFSSANTNWLAPTSLTVGDQISMLSGITPTAVVPEPSSLVTLAGFAAGAFGFIKRRKK